MKSFSTKLIVSSLIISLLVPGLAGCGKSTDKKSSIGTKATQSSSNFNKTGLPIVNDELTYRVIVPQATTSKKPIVEKEIFKTFQKQTNVKINWEEIPGSAFNEKMNLAINSGDLPDALMAGDVPQIADVIKAGLIIPWDNYMEISPQLKKLYEVYPVAEKASTYVGDGKHYFYPGIIPKEFSELRAPFFINKTWLDKLNLKVPTTTDELYNVLKEFKTKDPNGNGKADEIPLAADKVFFGFSLLDFLGPWDMMGIKNPAATTIRNGKLDFNPINPSFRLAMEYFNKLYKEGLIEAEALTMEQKTFQAKAGKETAIYGAAIDWDTAVFSQNANQYEPILPLKGPNGVQKWTFNDTIQVMQSMVIFKNCKEPEVLVRWMDNANSGTNILSIYAGVRGIGWELDEVKKEWYTLDEKLIKEGGSFNSHRVTEGIQNGFGSVFVSGYKYRSNPLATDYKKSQYTELYRPYLYKEYFPGSTPIQEATAESKEINLLWVELDTYIKSFIADAVMNGLNDSKWTSHIKKCEDLQYKKIVQYYQKQYDTVKPK